MAVKQLVKLFLDKKEQLPSVIEIVNKLQDQLNPIVNFLSSLIFANGNLLDNQILRTGQDNLIAHRLGTAYKHYWILNQDAQAIVWVEPNANPDKFINLKTSADVTISLFVSGV
jgi:hypothetical protein